MKLNEVSKRGSLGITQFWVVWYRHAVMALPPDNVIGGLLINTVTEKGARKIFESYFKPTDLQIDSIIPLQFYMNKTGLSLEDYAKKILSEELPTPGEAISFPISERTE